MPCSRKAPSRVSPPTALSLEPTRIAPSRGRRFKDHHELERHPSRAVIVIVIVFLVVVVVLAAVIAVVVAGRNPDNPVRPGRIEESDSLPDGLVRLVAGRG